MPDSRVLADHDVQKLRSLLRADEDDAFRLGVMLLESCQPTSADHDAIFTGDLVRAVVDRYDAARWEAVIALMRRRTTSLERFRACAVEAVRSRGFEKLRLASLTEISTELAEILASHREHLHAKVKSLSAPAAWALAKCKGWLHLDDLQAISPDVATALASHRGRLSLGGLTALSRDAARCLATHRGTLNLSGITTLTNDVAEQLARHDGELSLCGIASLSRECAAALAMLHSRLSLHLEEMTDDVATELAAHCGPGIAIGLPTLSSHAALMLADRSRDLDLYNLDTLTVEAATALAAGTARVRLRVTSFISAEARAALDCRWEQIKLTEPRRPWFPRRDALAGDEVRENDSDGLRW